MTQESYVVVSFCVRVAFLSRVRVPPNVQAQAQSPETELGCNDDVQIS